MARNSWSYLLVLTICYWIMLSNCQITVKTLSTACLCDTTSSCDSQCCCDAECPESLKRMLAKYGKCNKDGFGIPLCDSGTPSATSGVGNNMHLDDLYSGLRTIYTVIKKLFCLQRINIVDPTTFYNKTSSGAMIDESIAKLESSDLKMQAASISSVPPVQIMNFIFSTSEMGTCSMTNKLPLNFGPSSTRDCRALLQNSSIRINFHLSIQQVIKNFRQIRVFSIKSGTTPNPVSNNSIITSCSSSNCFNVVRYLRLFINPTDNQIKQDLSEVVVGDLDNIVDKCYVSVKYEYTYLNEDGSFPKVYNIGYKIGSPLQLLNKNDTSFWKIYNPLNLAFRKPNGDCRTNSNESADDSLMELKLGRNQFYSCIGDQSIIHSSLKNSFNYIGVMGSSTNFLNDYTKVEWSPTTLADSNNLVLKIFYQKIGAVTNEQYYILKTEVKSIQTTVKEKILFVEYQEVDSSITTYIPPKPRVDGYLPNDFLFPFYVAQ